jgi:hypothetical protein
MKTIQLTTLMVGLSFATFNSRAQSTPVLTNGLVAYYSFNGNADDTFGTNNGTPYGITYVTDRFGNPNAAASFAGNSSSYIVINTTNFTLTTLSISVWINPTVGLGIEGPRVFSTGGYELTCYNPSSDLGLTPRVAEFVDGLISSVFEAGVWTHVVATLSSNQVNIYLNGSLSVSVTNSELPSFVGWLPTIGVNAGNYNNDNYGGLIDDLAVYNRVLSPQEVSELYESFASGIITLPTITITGSTNQVYSVQYVTNLSLSNWTSLASNIVLQGTGPYYYPDTSSIGQPQRFYRVVVQ